MQWTKENGHSGILQPLQLHGDRVNVADDERVVGIGRRAQRLLDIEVCCARVETAPPPVLLGIVQTSRCVPVPQN